MTYESYELRIEEAEEIIRAQGRLIETMYESDLEAGWPVESEELVRIYEVKYSVHLEHPFT